jgi:hypothetical protein
MGLFIALLDECDQWFKIAFTPIISCATSVYMYMYMCNGTVM